VPRLISGFARRFLLPATVVAVASAVVVVPANATVFIPANATATLVSANPTDNTPHAQNGSMRAFAQIGDTIYAGGSFTGVKNAGATGWSTQSYLIAYDQNTGVITTTFAPQLDGQVAALAVNGDGNLIVGGAFTTVNGVARKGLVALDPATGATIPGFVGRSDGGVVRR